MKPEEIYYIQYGSFKVGYIIESDVDVNTAILKSIETVKETSDDIAKFDVDDWEDIKFHCREDYGNRQLQHYIKTGETI